MDGDGLWWCHADSTFDIAEVREFELIDLCEGIRVLPVVLDDVNVVANGQEAGEG